MARKKVNIGGYDFDIINPDTKQGTGIIQDLQAANLKSLYTLYKRPSETKESIYDAWIDWYNEISLNADFATFGCLRGSSNFFSIGAIVSRDNTIYYFYITASYNRVVILKNTY